MPYFIYKCLGQKFLFPKVIPFFSFCVEGADQVSDEEIQYDPASAGTLPLENIPLMLQKEARSKHGTKPENDENEIYDPESARFSPEEDTPSPPSHEHKLSITAKMEKLNREIEKEKAEIAIVKSKTRVTNLDNTSSISEVKGEKEKPNTITVAGFQGLPTGIASILFGEGSGSTSNVNEIPGLGDITEEATDAQNVARDPRKYQSKSSPRDNSSKSTSLSRMSDAELLAKAAAQMPTENIPQTMTEFSQQTNSPGARQNQYPPPVPQGRVSSLQTQPPSQGQIWPNAQVGMSPGASPVPVGPDRRSAPWMYGHEPRGATQAEHWEPPTYDRRDGTHRGNSDWSLPNRHNFSSGNAHRSWSGEAEYNNPENRRNWQGTNRDNWKQRHQSHYSDRRGRKDGNSFRDRDMRREGNREFTDRYDNRGRDRDYRHFRDSSPERNRSYSRSKSKEEDPRPPGEEDRNFDRPFDRTTLSRSRSRSPTARRDASNQPQASTSMQTIDERIANVVDRLPE